MKAPATCFAIGCILCGIAACFGFGTASAAQPRPAPTNTSCSAQMRLTDPYLTPIQVTAICAGQSVPTTTKMVTAPLTVPCTQGASTSLIVGQEPPGATVTPMACTISLNPDWGGLTATASDGLSVSLTGPAGGY